MTSFPSSIFHLNVSTKYVVRWRDDTSSRDLNPFSSSRSCVLLFVIVHVMWLKLVYNLLVLLIMWTHNILITYWGNFSHIHLSYDSWLWLYNFKSNNETLTLVRDSHYKIVTIYRTNSYLSFCFSCQIWIILMKRWVLSTNSCSSITH